MMLERDVGLEAVARVEGEGGEGGGEMTEEMRREVRGIVTRILEKAVVTQETVVEKLVKSATVMRMIQRWRGGGFVCDRAEVVWAEVAVMQAEGIQGTQGLERMIQGAARVPRPNWREKAMGVSGRVSEWRRWMSNSEWQWWEDVQMVLAHARRAGAGIRGGEIWEWQDEEGPDRETVILREGDMRERLQSTKSMFPGKGGAQKAMVAVNLLARMGLVGGALGKAIGDAEVDGMGREWALGWRSQGAVGDNTVVTPLVHTQDGEQQRLEWEEAVKEAELGEEEEERVMEMEVTLEEPMGTVGEVLGVEWVMAEEEEREGEGSGEGEKGTQRGAEGGLDEKGSRVEEGDGGIRRGSRGRAREWGDKQCKGKSRIKEKRSRREGKKRWVVLDLFSGTQSMRAAVEERGWVYVPVDMVEDIWSPEERKVVKNLVLDLSGIKHGKLWGTVKRWVKKRGLVAEGDTVGLKFIWASPPCTTYTRLDSMQKEPYRFHEKGGPRPPMKVKGLRGRVTDKGRIAGEADKLVKDILAILEWGVKVMGAHWGMENPDAWLKYREFMGTQQLEQRGLYHRRHLINYCNWGHIYFKGTNVWISVMEWEPTGKSGNGKCCQMCGMGFRDAETGGYRHWNSIGQETWRLKRGVDKQGLKCMVPVGMHREYLALV